MILQALTRYYEDLSAQGEISAPGWGRAKVGFALSLSPQGEIVSLTELTQEVQAGKKTVLRPLDMEVPQSAKRSSGVMPNFLCDNAAYFFGIDFSGKPQRAKKCFLAAQQLHTRLLSGIGHPAARAVAAFFGGEWQGHPEVEQMLPRLKGGGNIVFRVDGEYVHRVPQVREAWQRHHGAEADSAPQRLCLVTGGHDSVTLLHPSVKGVRGAQSSGASLVSFNAPAYESYGKTQGENAPVGRYAAFAYGTALDLLLQDRQHVQHIGDMTIVFWGKGAKKAEQDMFAAFAFPQAGGGEQIGGTELKAAMGRLSGGRPVSWAGAEISPDTPFYVLALAPNAARISVRFFLSNTLGAFAGRILEHQNNLEIALSGRDKRQQLGFWALLQETVNQKSRDKAPSPGMAGELVRAVLAGGRYPATLLNSVMLRIGAERDITRGRAAIIKAYYIKNPHPDCPKEVLTVQLNDSPHIPYRLGRVFSVLEAIQQAANPGINATIKDKYFNSASATPATVFPTLINLAQKHLRKLDTGLRIHYEKQLGQLLAPLGEAYPQRLSLPAQGSFQLGYYHQEQKRFEKKEDEKDA